MRPFDHRTPTSIDEAIAALPAERSRTGAQVIAGGQDLLTVMKDRIDEPEALVDIGGLGLARIDEAKSGDLVIGATTTIQAIADSEVIAKRFPALREAARSVASPQIRSQGTLGGNLNQRPRCPYYRHPDVTCFKKGGNVCLAEFGFSKYAAIFGGGPSYFSHPSDMATALVAAGASVDVSGPEGDDTIPLDAYYVLPDAALDTETVLAPNQVVRSVVVPAPTAGERSTYLKFKERASYDFALAAVAVTVNLDGDTIVSARVVLGGVAPTPWPSLEAAAALVGRPMSPETWKAAGEAAVADAVPLDHNGYKVHLVKGVLYRALESLA
ncbi:MAG: xanthine dehydrogenase family protein subunit M [Planctomycetota bacterium]